jgi:hypothetical protein
MPEPEPSPGSSGLAERTVKRTWWVGVALSSRAYTDARCPSAADWMVESTDSQDDDGNDDDDDDDDDNDNALLLLGPPPLSGCVLSMVRSGRKVEMASVLPPSPAADATLDAAARMERTARTAARHGRRTLLLSLQQGLRALCQDLPHRLGRRRPAAFLARSSTLSSLLFEDIVELFRRERENRVHERSAPGKGKQSR